MAKICEVSDSGTGQVVIWINSLDHCDPHVHCGDKGNSWEGRIKFSFINNIASFWDCISKTDPGRGVFARIEQSLGASYLRRCRAEWWRIFGQDAMVGCCLVNTQ